MKITSKIGGGWSPPAIDDLGVPILEPPEALPEGTLDFPLNSVDLVACNPLLSLELRVAEQPTSAALGLLQLHLSLVVLIAAVVVHR